MVFNRVKQILNEKIIVDIDREKSSIRLKEDNPQSKLKEVVVFGLHKDSVAFKLDYRKLPQKSHYLSKKKGLHSGCDYVIVTRSDAEENLILFCELKSTYKGAAAQLRNSTPFIDYMASLLKIHYNFDFNFKQHFIVFVAKRLNKQSTYLGKRKKECFTKNYKDLQIKYFKNTQKIYLSKILDN